MPEKPRGCQHCDYKGFLPVINRQIVTWGEIRNKSHAWFLMQLCGIVTCDKCSKNVKPFLED
jgi:hypothetical protein